jgi:MFS family permease
VISYSAIAELFPKEMSGQANAVLNTLHIGGAFVIQTSIGLVISHWTMNGGHYPVIAYKTAFCANLIIQAIALGWFFVPFGRRTEPVALEYP